jgi:hypothetical protein
LRVGRLIEHVAGPDLLHRRGNRLAAKLRLIVGRRHVLRRQLRQRRRRQIEHLRRRLLPARASLLAGLLHQLLVAANIDAHPPLLRHDAREVDGKAVGVVELEGVLARNAALARSFVKQRDAAIKRATEADFFVLNQLDHTPRVLPQFRERFAHRIHDDRHERMQKRVAQAELLTTEADCAAEDAPQHIPAPLVAWNRAVRQREAQRANVIRDHPKCDVDPQLWRGRLSGRVRRIRLRIHSPIPMPAQRRQLLPKRNKQIDRIVITHVLQHLCNSLEPHPRIDVLFRQRRELSARIAVVLDEDVVPDLHHARVFAAEDGRAAGLVRRAVDEDFGARAARAGVAHLPEVVLAAEVDSLVRQIRNVLPDLHGLVVTWDAGGGFAGVDADV